MKRAVVGIGVAGCVVVALVGVPGRGGAAPVSYAQVAVTTTVNPATLDPRSLALPVWALPASATPIDSIVLSPPYCVPDTRDDDIVDEFLLVHRDWCEGLGAWTGLFQASELGPKAAHPLVSEWAASVYETSDQAREVITGINSYLGSLGYGRVTCVGMSNCTSATFQDVETIKNPDGTTSPAGSHDVVYDFWSEGNVVGEVAVVEDPANTPQQVSDANVDSYAIAQKADVFLRELLAGEPITPPTATPSPTPTSTATATPTAAPMTFSALRAKIGYGSSRPEGAYRHPSLSIIKVGQKVQLYLFVRFSGITGTVPVQLGFRITRKGKTVYFDRWTDKVTSVDNGDWSSFSEPYRSRAPGSYIFSGTIFFGATHEHKTVAFTVK